MRTVILIAMTAFGAAAEQPMIEGNPKSNVRVVIFEDLQCPDCAVFRKMLDEKLLPKYKATVAFEHHDFPLAKHSWARQAAVAAGVATARMRALYSPDGPGNRSRSPIRATISWTTMSATVIGIRDHSSE